MKYHCLTFRLISASLPQEMWPNDHLSPYCLARWWAVISAFRSILTDLIYELFPQASVEKDETNFQNTPAENC